MDHIKSYGTCTRNEQGMFEIHWEVESTWFKRLFKIQTEFKYMCDYEVGKRFYKSVNYTDYLNVVWYDQDGVVLKDKEELLTITYCLVESGKIDNQF